MRVVINPPARITAGAAPLGSTCWLVGRDAAVFSTTNGVLFTRVPFPEPVDLIGVRATAALRATVTTADGRTFTTTDGGLSWR